MKIFFDKEDAAANPMVGDVVSAAQTPVVKREVIIDMLRGFAVLVMVITHVIAITYAGGSGNSSLVYYLGLFGGIFSFTAFLFISGISTYLSVFSHPSIETEEELKRKRRKKIGRIFKLLIAYYVIATASIFVNTSLYSFPPSFSWVQNIISTVFLTIIPQFSEFIIPLIIYSLSILLVPRFYKLLIKTPLFGLFFMSVIYGIGTLISQIDLKSDHLNTLKALLGGQVFTEGSLHTFPVFQYFPIFLLGIYLGHFLIHNQELKKRLKLNFLWILIFGTITVVGTVSYLYLQSNLLFPLPDQGRFPPSITFLTLSLVLTLLVLLKFQIFFKLIPKFLRRLYNYFGVNAIETLVFHTVLLFAFQYITTSSDRPDGLKVSSLTEAIIVYIVVLFLSAILISVKTWIKKWTLQDNDSENVWWFFTERAVSSLILIIIVAFVATSFYNETFIKGTTANSNTIVFKKRLIQDEDPWWNHDYTTYRTVTVKNNDTALPLFAGSWITLAFNHEAALSAGTALNRDGNDLRLVYYDKNNDAYLELPFYLENAHTVDTKLSFKLLDNINPGESVENYFLYYGFELADKFKEPQDKYSTPPIANGITLGAENSHQVFAQANRKWFLLSGDNAGENLNFKADINSGEISDTSIVTYSVLGTSKAGRMSVSEGRKYQATVKVNDLEPGVYTIQASITDPLNTLKVNRSQNIKFYVSYPLYVNWSFDWEGWDVLDSDLAAIGNMEATYGIVATHYFNPRIYVQEQSTQNNTIGIISPERAVVLTEWMKNQAARNGDEIGMHMHMWQDMVKEAGVNPRGGPVISGTYGSDVPTYSYSQSELEQIFKWGKQKLLENGLGSATSYRTGAWMSSPEVLKAAQNAGFLIDSSGRTGGKVNANFASSTSVPWNLTPTTYPYLPNKNDINKWEGDKSNRLSIWEFPNNGADSYWFPKEELIKRFDDNFSNKKAALTHPQVVTYLTHPHWFNGVDRWKLVGLFDYISNFKYSKDGGPVVFDSLENIYNEWDKVKFINGN